MSAEQLDTLTPRELEILALIAEGDSLPEIAEKLHRSLKTIESHRLSLGRKLRASNRVELARIAIAAGLVTIDARQPGVQPNAAGKELGWLQSINQAVQGAKGPAFLQRFCNAASELPGIDIAAICMPDPYRPERVDPYHRFVVAVAERGTAGEPMRYDAINTPCETIIEQGACCFSEGVAKAYPRDAWLNEMNAEGFVGIQLQSKQGQAIGGLGLISRSPLSNIEAYRSVIEFFAPHIGCALEVSIELDKLRAQYDQLKALRDASDHTLVATPSAREDTLFLTALAQISQKLHALAGAGFLRGMVDAVCETFGLRYAGICVLDNPRASKQLTSVTFRDGAGQGDTVCYNSKGTPCEVVLNEGLLCLEMGASKSFPEDDFLRGHGIEGFAGVRLPDPAGDIIGVIWVVDPKPLSEPEALQHVLQHFAPRLGAELANFMKYEMLLQEYERLQHQLEANTRKTKQTSG